VLKAELEFAAGQSLTLRLMIDGVEHRRSYSICSPVGDQPRIGVRMIPTDGSRGCSCAT
jgi:ring-1,2-phenylacetyl-CoA epoxidase subunit PaaE